MKKETILKSVEKEIKVKTSEKTVHKDFFKDREGLYVWDSFINNIVSKAENTKSDAEFSLSSFDLTKRATDEEIEKSLPEKHIFSETEVCAVVAELIQKQSKGEEGVLKNDGNLNLFYTPSRVVVVSWFGSGWGVSVWSRGGRWFGGGRVFSTHDPL